MILKYRPLSFFLADPLDNKYVKAEACSNPEFGDCLFAARDIPADTVFTQYSGRTYDKEELVELEKAQTEKWELQLKIIFL